MPRYLGDHCLDELVDYLFGRCPCAFSEEEGQELFDGLVRIIEREVERIVNEQYAHAGAGDEPRPS